MFGSACQVRFYFYVNLNVHIQVTFICKFMLDIAMSASFTNIKFLDQITPDRTPDKTRLQQPVSSERVNSNNWLLISMLTWKQIMAGLPTTSLSHQFSENVLFFGWNNYFSALVSTNKSLITAFPCIVNSFMNFPDKQLDNYFRWSDGATVIYQKYGNIMNVTRRYDCGFVSTGDLQLFSEFSFVRNSWLRKKSEVCGFNYFVQIVYSSRFCLHI